MPLLMVMTPLVHEFKQLVFVGFQLLQRLALDARHHPCEEAIPSSCAIWLNGRPLLTSSPTASRLNSSVN
jgi:hypothetical protein